MGTISRDELDSILSSGNFDALVGTVETDWIDFKGDPYHLSNDQNKIELAKDMTAMANHNGGVILIGPRTVKKKTHTGEEVEKIELFAEDALNPKQYLDTLNAWTHPHLRDVGIWWHKSAGEPSRGLFSIVIPAQPAELRPFLVKASIVNGRNTELLVGLMRRARDETDVTDIHELHGLIRAGTSYADSLADLSEDVREIKELLSSARPAPVSAVEDISAILDVREAEALKAAELHDGPAYVLSAMPIPPGHIPILFKPDDRDFRRLVHPENFRSHGFDINGNPYEDSKPVKGELRRDFVKGYKDRDLWKDGCLVFAASGNFLCWGAQENENPFFVNPLALCESVFLFVKYHQTVMNHMTAKPQKILYRIGLHAPSNADVGWEMTPWSVDTIGRSFRHDVSKALASVVRKEFETAGDNSVGGVAHKLVSEFYLWFGIEDKDGHIPYTDTIDGVKVVSEEKLIVAGGR